MRLARPGIGGIQGAQSVRGIRLQSGKRRGAQKKGQLNEFQPCNIAAGIVCRARRCNEIILPGSLIGLSELDAAE